MNKKQPITLISTLLLLLGSIALSMPALAQRPIPSIDDGKPDTEPGGPRVSPPPPAIAPITPPTDGRPDTDSGSVRPDCIRGEKSLTALTPATQKVGLTVAPRPTFFVYIPETEVQEAVFSLRNERDQLVYLTKFKLEKTSGVRSLTIPDIYSSPELEVGKNYRWSFSLICGNQYIEVGGFIQRVNPSPELVAKLEKAAERDRPSIYAEAGIWHESLTTLARLRRANPNDRELIGTWANILKSVGLDTVAQEPLITSP